MVRVGPGGQGWGGMCVQTPPHPGPDPAVIYGWEIRSEADRVPRETRAGIQACDIGDNDAVAPSLRWKSAFSSHRQEPKLPAVLCVRRVSPRRG